MSCEREKRVAQRRDVPPTAGRTGVVCQYRGVLSGHRRRHVAIDEAAVLADYDTGAPVAAICATHRISRDTLYRTLDRYDVPRRQLNAPRLPTKQRERILADHAADVDVAEIARRRRVAPIAVVRVVARHGGR